VENSETTFKEATYCFYYWQTRVFVLVILLKTKNTSYS
jgi:hypothetical protein